MAKILTFTLFVAEVRSLAIKDRKCRFIDEYKGIMKIFKFYTRSTLFLEPICCLIVIIMVFP